MMKYDTHVQVEDYYGTFAAEPANEDVACLSSYTTEEYEEYIEKESRDHQG